MNKTEQALARIFAICDGVAESGQTIRTEKEGEEAAKEFFWHSQPAQYAEKRLDFSLNPSYHLPADNTKDHHAMPALKNPKHERFAQAVALNTPASQAYREQVSGGKCSESTAETTGPKLAKESHIALRIAELRESVGKTVEKKFNLTKESWLEELREIATEARMAEDFSAATGALSQIGKAAAFYAPEEVKHSGSVGIENLYEAVAKVFGK